LGISIDIKNLPSNTMQLPLLGGLINEKTESILYSWRKEGQEGWSFGPATCLIIPKNFCKK